MKNVDIKEDNLDFKFLVKLFLVFFKIGCFTFGGGFAMIPVIETEIVLKRRWMKEKNIVDIFAVAQSFPGAIAVNSSALIGYRLAKVKGALFSITGVILPSFIIITTIATFFSRFNDYTVVQNAFMGIRSCVVGLILYAAIKIGKNSIVDKFTFLIAATTVSILLFTKIQPFLIIAGGIGTGILIYFFSAKIKEQKSKKGDDNDDIC